MRVPFQAYRAISTAIKNSVDGDFSGEPEEPDMPTGEEAAAIMRRMDQLVSEARKVDEKTVDLRVEFFSESDVSCLLGIITGLWLSYRAASSTLRERGDYDTAGETLTMAHSLATIGGAILKSRLAERN